MCAAISSTLSIGALLISTGEQGAAPLNMAGYVILGCASLAACLLVLCGGRLTTVRMVVPLYVGAVSICVWDLTSRTIGTHSWPAFVIIIDMLLVLEVDARFTTGLVVAALVWLLVAGAEEVYRFGLLDLPGLKPQGGEYGGREYFSRLSDCTELPCASGSYPPRGLLLAVGVFIIDFVVTRGFARDVLKEQRSMERTISIVQEIASLLAGYDVEGVAEMLEAHREELPEGMIGALRGLEENLRKYRPYLPAALFEEMEEEAFEVKHGAGRLSVVAPPGLCTETATLVFTDIRSSTMIWEHAPEGMRAGLKIHNSVMRKAMSLFGGYEVKTIGDAFMVAFSTTQDGVNFGLHVHELLREASWPASLLEDAPICAEQDSLWGGLTVRIGVNTGPVTIEENTLTGRTDYFGHTVNVASRLESTCKPGAVAIPSDLYTSECRECDAVVGEAEALDLKGVSGTTFVCCVWPLSLAGRKQMPLREAGSMQWPEGANEGDGWRRRGSQHELSLSHSLCNPNPAKKVEATLGAVDVVADDAHDASIQLQMNIGLSALTVPLDQSGGTLVTLLGSRVCVGWNLTRPSPAHMENAIRFAQRLQIVATLAGAGLVSGLVQHGDVGARKQRFVTVMGRSVHRSWALCDQAVRGGGLCLFEPPLGTVLPLSLDKVVVMDKSSKDDDVYKILPSDANEHI